MYSLVSQAKLQLLFCGEGRNFPAGGKQTTARSTASDQLTAFPRLLVSVVRNSRAQVCSSEFSRLKMEAETLSKTDSPCVFVLPCFGVQGRVQFCLPAAGCTRAAGMTALTNKRTGRDAHRCMLRRTQTAQYEANPLPVSPLALAHETPGLLHPPLPPPPPHPPPAALPPPSHPNGSKTEWGSARKLHLDGVFV